MRSLALACVSALAGLTMCAGAQASPTAIAAPTLPLGHAGRWITGFATTNLYFHLSMAYAILRAHGVAIGKVDLFPTGL